MSERAPLLELIGVRKEYFQGHLANRRRTFSLEADFRLPEPSIVGVMGANGSGKTTLFEIITGTTPPTAGVVHCSGQNIQEIKYDQRDRIAIHYHQSYQVRKLRRTKPNLLLRPARSDYPSVHLFDEPQFNTQDGYIGFMLDFFRHLRAEGRLVLMSLHPTEHYHLDILQEICERYLFVFAGTVHQFPSWSSLVADDDVRRYLGRKFAAYPAAGLTDGGTDE